MRQGREEGMENNKSRGLLEIRAVHNHLERDGNNMISGYGFGKTETLDCWGMERNSLEW